MTQQTGRYCELKGIPEVTALEAGMDFRRPEYRREAFHRFYQFTLKYRVHPGCVYFALPALARHLKLNVEGALWLAYLNGNCQNPVTSWLLFKEFPTPHTTDPAAVRRWLDAHWAQVDFDTDRRYWKNKLPEAIKNYQTLLGQRSQEGYFNTLIKHSDGTEAGAFDVVWETVRRDFLGMGRLSAFSYLEYLRIFALPIQPSGLFLDDISGSKSHRNGLCKVLGRDDLEWHDSNPAFNGVYERPTLRWLAAEASVLLKEARSRAAGQPWARDVNYFTLESAFCTYKSCYRPNRRYPNCYADMMYDRIRKAERSWPREDFGLFWQIRSEALPPRLLRERNPRDVGLAPLKQNIFRETGTYPMLDVDDPAFANDYTDTFLERNYVSF